MTHDDWGQRQAAAVGQAIRAIRGKRSAQWVSDRAAEVGYPISRSLIADLEIGRRKHVLLPELLTLAAALDTPPIRLLYYGLPDEQVEALPGAFCSAEDAMQWVTGDGLRPATEKPDGTITIHAGDPESIRLIAAIRARQKYMHDVGGKYKILETLARAHPDELDDGDRELLQAHRDQLDELNDEIRRHGGHINE